jgi:hypothetical protein
MELIGFMPFLSRGTTFTSGIGIQLLGAVALLLCVVTGWALIADYYHGGWAQIRKYALNSWAGSLVAVWLVLFIR